MARKPRVFAVGYPHHIVQRGRNREDVFHADSDRRAYLKTLAEFRSELNIRVYGYCLMTNHVHLIIEPGETAKSLSVLMKGLAGRHAQRLNKAYGHTGSPWEGRFKCSLIKTDRYLLACSRYVDLNPVRAGLASKPEDYDWWRVYREFVEHGISREELAIFREAAQVI